MWAFLKSLFSKIVRAFKYLLKTVFDQAVVLLLSEAKDLATQTVKEIADDPTLITDEEKRNEAFRRLKNRTMSRGLTIRDNLLNILIEITVAFLKKKGEL